MTLKSKYGTAASLARIWRLGVLLEMCGGKTAWMRSPLRWILDQLGDDPVGGDPDAIVEVGRVALWVSEIVITQLADQGIRATSSSMRAHPYFGNSQVRIYTTRVNAEVAREVIDEVTSA